MSLFQELPSELLEMIRGYAKPHTFSCVEYVDPNDVSEYKEVVLDFPHHPKEIISKFDNSFGCHGLARYIANPRRQSRGMRVGLVKAPERRIVWLEGKPFYAQEIVEWPVLTSETEFDLWLRRSVSPPTLSTVVTSGPR